MAGKFKISVTGMPVAYGYLDGRADYCLLRDFETWSIIRVGSIIRNTRVHLNKVYRGVLYRFLFNGKPGKAPLYGVCFDFQLGTQRM